MLSCKEVTHLVSEAQDRKLSLTERIPLRVHLAICQGCRNFQKQVSFLRVASRGYFRRDDDHT